MSAAPQGEAPAKTGGRDLSQPTVAPVINLPKGGGAIRGIGEKFAANPVTGTGSMTVPIATSPGRSGFGPQLSLAYDSGSGNGPFGFGWSLSLPSITRKTDKGLPKYQDADESDVFVLSGAEDLVPAYRRNADGSWTRDQAGHHVIHEDQREGYRVRRYRPRIEGLFARIERWTNRATGEIHWQSISRDNVTTLYGTDNRSRIFDPADPTRVFSWLICQSYDDKGNAIVYEYAAENDENVDRAQANERNRLRSANRYPKRIKYGNRRPNRDAGTWQATDPTQLPNNTWMFEVVFDYGEDHYETLPLDPALPEVEQHRFVRASALADLPWDSQQRNWAVRPDPFSTYRSGFEVRTYRRCRRVLMFHHIPDLPTGEKGYDGLVRSMEFDYADLDYARAVAVEAELAHQGSTRFASFIRRSAQSGYAPDDNQAAIVRNGAPYATYLKKSLPPLELEYSKATIQEQVLDLDTASLEDLPFGLDGDIFQWVDLHGEGITGILTEQAGWWFYKRNLSPLPIPANGSETVKARFSSVELVTSKPNLAVAGGAAQFMDLAGDGLPDLVVLQGPTPGRYEHDDAEGWQPFRPFTSRLNRDTRDPNLRFVDLDGDGHADVLITEDDAFIWHPSLAEEGFGPANRVVQALDEEKGPRLVFADGTQSIYLADMSGDGLTDLVRIRNGEVCFWPNIGWRFGAKVTMDNAPWFDNPDQFDQRRIRIADIDGSGTTDIIYLARDGVRLYLNQSGNRLSEARRLAQFPPIDNVSSIVTVDLLGNGTACLVWSSPLPGDTGRQMRYIDLMGGIKPHLLIKSINNLGAETRVHYSPSTKFYLRDKRDGRPWITRLPFPVHVVERVETYDPISRNRFITRYDYHHGYFDGEEEREFRGFGMVEQRDTEEFAALNADGQAPAATNLQASSHVPPVLTKTWFHTGAYLGGDHISDFFAGLLDADDIGEYYREPRLTDDEARAFLLEDTVLPGGLTIEEEREACRALKGSMLRQETYALDGTGTEQYPNGHPYTVTEQNFTVRMLQPREDNRHAVFLTQQRESLSYHYERDPTDPRFNHALTLEVDDFGNVLKSAAIGYGRRQPDLSLSSTDQPRQTGILITYTENSVTNPIDSNDEHRAPLPCESRTWELTGVIQWQNDYQRALERYFRPAHRTRFTFEEVLRAGTGAAPLDYEQDPTAGVLEKRLIEHIRTYYRRNDLTGPSPLGELQSLALPFETFKLAFTPGLVAKVYGNRATNAIIQNEGRYVHTEGDANWWIPSGRSFYSPDPADAPAQELTYARQHFFLPHRYRDPFHANANRTESFVAYDRYDLLFHETTDALGNQVTVGERRWVLPDGAVLPERRRNDYRVLLPALSMDPNRNCSEVRFDALGMVVGTATMGKPEENPRPGDRLTAAFRTDMTQAEIDQLLANPKGPMAAALLGDATTRVVYDLTAYWREPDPARKPPAVAATLVRETHVSDLQGQQTKIQVSLSYSDGFGREIQGKTQAEQGPVPERNANGQIIVGADGQPVMTRNVPPNAPPRWVGSGWTIFNNKGKPVRQYEPFFTDTHRFEFDVRIGVSPVLFYDPAERVIATLHPNQTYEKVVFDPWQQTTYDVNDTCAARNPETGDPRTDADIRGIVAGYFRTQPANWQTWYAQRIGGGAANERNAAQQAAAHANTPTTTHFDALGRPFLTVARNRVVCPNHDLDNTEDSFITRIDLDIEGNQRAVRDERKLPANGLPLGVAEERIVMLYAYDMLGNRIQQFSMDADTRWTLNDVAGKPIRAWDSRGFMRRMTYDSLRRSTGLFVTENGVERQAERTVHGENPGEAKNHRTRVYQVYDAAGRVTSVEYDFKGNLRESTRDLLPSAVSRQGVNWAQNPAPNDGTFTTRSTYDSLNRPLTVRTPDNSIYRPAFNEANLLDKVDVNLRGANADGQPVWTPFVTNIDYNAKGQRELIVYGSGVRTAYEYDWRTFRLSRLTTTRPAGVNGWTATLFSDPTVVQDIRYTYDPAGNITSIEDASLARLSQAAPADNTPCEYTYDAMYRLIEATGREHGGQTAHDFNPPSRRDYDFGLAGFVAHPNDWQAMRRYTERYVYDAVGNFLQMQHRRSDPAQPGWTRRYEYSQDSLIEPGTGKRGNRLTRTLVGNGFNSVERYTYVDAQGNDVHGCVTSVNNMRMTWDFKDQLQEVDLVGGGKAFYVYDATGERVRKIIETQGGVRRQERIYLGGFEIYREFNDLGASVTLERETLHVVDDKQRIALVETRTIGNDPAPWQLIRYQFTNHLGSAILELDEQARVVSYEEYSPYGNSTVQAMRSLTETAKRYRYTGKERDEESGLYYHGARYYAPWLARWMACDPSGIVDGANVYEYVHGNPVRYRDPNGQNSFEDLAQFVRNQAGFEQGAIRPPTYQSSSASPFGTAAHGTATTVIQEMQATGFVNANRLVSEPVIVNGIISPLTGPGGAPKGSLVPDLLFTNPGTTSQSVVGQTASAVAQEIGDLKYGGGVAAGKYSQIGVPVHTINGVTNSATTNPALLEMAAPQQAAATALESGAGPAAAVEPAVVAAGASEASVTTATEAVVVSESTKTVAATTSKATKVAKGLGAAGGVLGSLVGGVQVGTGLDQLAQGKTGEGAVNVTEGAVNLGMAIGVPALVKSGAVVAGGGAVAVTAVTLVATASVGLAAETARAAVKGEETPIDVADKFYGTHFGDIYGWVSGAYSKQ